MLPETTLAAFAAAAMLLAWAFALSASRRRERGLPPLAVAGLSAATAALTVAIVVRWAAVGHPPVFGSYENSLAATWFLMVGTLLLSRAEGWRLFAVGSVPVALAVLGWGLRFNHNRLPLTISERSVWVDVHAAVAWMAFVALTMALCAALLVLARALESRRRRPFAVLAGLPSHGAADDVVAQSVSWAFVGFTGVIATGAFYSYLLFGEVWRWDAVEVLALAIWLHLGLTLHLRSMSGWRGARLAAVAASAYAGVVAIYWLLALFPVSSYHYFELPF